MENVLKIVLIEIFKTLTPWDLNVMYFQFVKLDELYLLAKQNF